MAKKKKPENETPEQASERGLFDLISNNATRSEKTSWNRKMDNMVKLIAELQPIEEKILTIIHDEKMPIQDQIAKLREDMIKECIHPPEYLVMDDGGVRCKFCEKRLGVRVDANPNN